MKDCNGIEIQVGDVLQCDCGSAEDCVLCMPADAHRRFEVRELRSDDEAVDVNGWVIDSKRAVLVERAPAVKDKWGREVKIGDLLVTTNGVVRRIAAPPANWPSLRSEWAKTEVLQRGLPTDPVPDHFKPERDAQGRPVLEERYERCDGCGKVAVLFPGATVRDKPGCICADCRARCVYPVTAKTFPPLDARAEPQFEYAQAWAEAAKRAPDLRCILCGRAPWTAAQRAFLAERKAERWCCGECPDEKSKPLDTPPQPVVIAGGVYAVSSGTWDEPSLASRYAAFDKRVREIVEKVAPLAPVVTDRVVGNAERADGILVAFKDKLIGEIVFPFTHDDETFAINFEYHLGTYLMAAGKKAMWKR